MEGLTTKIIAPLVVAAVLALCGSYWLTMSNAQRLDVLEQKEVRREQDSRTLIRIETRLQAIEVKLERMDRVY